VRSNGVPWAEAKYTLETPEGTRIAVTNRGTLFVTTAEREPHAAVIHFSRVL
jgi:hypothetical protein